MFFNVFRVSIPIFPNSLILTPGCFSLSMMPGQPLTVCPWLSSKGSEMIFLGSLLPRSLLILLLALMSFNLLVLALILVQEWLDM